MKAILRQCSSFSRGGDRDGTGRRLKVCGAKRYVIEPFGIEILFEGGAPVHCLWKFSTKNGKERGILPLYILHSLQREPKSGYDLLKEIDEKTGGRWVPSKGTLYPVLRQLEAEGLIAICSTEARSKNIFELTETGRETLQNIKTRKKESREKLFLVKNLMIDIFGEDKAPIEELIFEIRTLVETIPPGKESQALAILGNCRSELEGIQ
jgi:DNA-binding PadR family transcriptional regulator